MATFNGKKQYTGQEASNISLGQGGWIYATSAGCAHVAVGNKSYFGNESYSLVSFADGTDGDTTDTTVTVTGHPFVNGDSVIIDGSTSYDGVYEVDNVTTNTFDIEKAYTAEAAAGSVIINKLNLTATYPAGITTPSRSYYSSEYFCGVKAFATVAATGGSDLLELDIVLADNSNCEVEPADATPSTFNLKLRGGESIFGQFKEIKLTAVTAATAIIHKG